MGFRVVLAVVRLFSLRTSAALSSKSHALGTDGRCAPPSNPSDYFFGLACGRISSHARH